MIAGSEKLVANDTFNAIMVGQNDGADEFVFKKEVVAGLTSLTQQKATIAGYSRGDKIDISDYEERYGEATHVMNGAKTAAVVTFKDEADATRFTLTLAFQEAVVGDLEFLYGTPTPM